MVWYSHLFQNFPQFLVIHTVKGFGIVSKAEVDVYTSINFLKICPLEAVMVTVMLLWVWEQLLEVGTVQSVLLLLQSVMTVKIIDCKGFRLQDTFYTNDLRTAMRRRL